MLFLSVRMESTTMEPTTNVGIALRVAMTVLPMRLMLNMMESLATAVMKPAGGTQERKAVLPEEVAKVTLT
jgi:hypothetical protein